MPEDAAECDDIAKQLYKESDNIDVIMGGGRKFFAPEGVNDISLEAERKDGNNYLKEWREWMG